MGFPMRWVVEPGQIVVSSSTNQAALILGRVRGSAKWEIGYPFDTISTNSQRLHQGRR